MEFVFNTHTIIAIGLIVVIICLMAYTATRPVPKPATLSEHDCLEVMDSETWKTGIVIKKDLERLKRGSLTYLQVRENLEELVRDGFALQQPITDYIVEDEFPHNGIPLKVREYKLTLRGVQERDKCQCEGA